MSKTTCIVWFRQDLRVADNPALEAAARRRGPVVPVFVWSPEGEGEWPLGGAARWWLHRSLRTLDARLRKLGAGLVIRNGDAALELRKLAKETAADVVHSSRRYEPSARDTDARVACELSRDGVRLESFSGSLLFDPEEVHTQAGKPMQVFTPFWKKCQSMSVPEDLTEPDAIQPINPAPQSLNIEQLELLPRIDWAAGLRDTWQPGEDRAIQRLRQFLDHAAAKYQHGRDRPDSEGTSRLSPHLQFGEISPRQVWHAVSRWAKGRRERAAEPFLRQLAWREFAHHLLVHFPHTTDEPLRDAFTRFPWMDDESRLRAWQRGATGYPLIDAGMRQLWHTGWMHNRVRMAAASFLTKHLLVSWTHGARWFWDTLVDACLANNTLGWQWTAGCGADAAPYFRIFNPVLQGQKFDPEGDYVRRWVPELACLPAKWIHQPFDAPRAVLDAAGVTLGEDYPNPIVVHKEARERALAAYQQIKRS